MLKEGDRAPDFSLPNQRGETVSLATELTKGELALYFYPADFTPVCTAEACAFRDTYAELRQANANVIGISPQSVESHRRFAEAFNIPFALLFDAGKSVIKAYGVDGPFGWGVRRATFHIGQDGIIHKRVVSDLFVGGHLELVKDLTGVLK
ncbi:MAG: peroxiredoxin [Gammaproteobacteria bacterium]|nr:peroxiredoxin [Gammaproteobacteria bacterium]